MGGGKRIVYIGSEEGLDCEETGQSESRNGEEIVWASRESSCRETERRAGSGGREIEN
jgi:hypothetical protein